LPSTGRRAGASNDRNPLSRDVHGRDPQCPLHVDSSHFYRRGGTTTHHHAVGRDHMPWRRAQRPDLFGRALAAAKSALDPAGIMNPGVLVP
jgi:FAD/FMN-containing dehydrogenase